MTVLNPYMDIGLSNTLVPGSNMGLIIYVDGAGGSNSNNGLTPDEPLLTLTAALALCTNDRNDTIVVLDYYQPTGETWPVDFNKSKVRCVGSPSASFAKWAVVDADGDTACFSVSASDVLLQHFRFLAGGSHGGVEFSGGVARCGVYDCEFLNPSGYGILMNAGDVGFGVEIARCVFWNVATNSILINGDDGAWMMFRDNIFTPVAGGGICFLANGGSGSSMVLDNVFAVDSNVAGRAISLTGTEHAWILDGNRANFGETEMGTNPFRDVSGSTVNHWINNIWGVTPSMPVTA